MDKKIASSFIVAGNWDDSLIEGLSKLRGIDSIFARLTTDATGGGRAAYVLPNIDRKRAQEHIKLAHSRGIKFIYLYNASCLGNMEFTKAGRKRLIEELEWVVEVARVDAITVANNFLFDLLRKRYPKLKVGIGVFMKMEEPERYKYYQDKGAGYITIDFNIARNFRLLEKIRKNIRTELHMFVNNICLFHCPHRIYHRNVLTHMSKRGSRSSNVCVDYHTWTCDVIKCEKPEELIKSRWIRPEDLHFYEDLGFTHFKITDRSRSTPWLVRAAKAYSERRYDGNLCDILSLEIPGDEKSIQPEINRRFRRQLLRHCVSDQMWLKGSFGWGKYGRPHIDNSALDGFLKFYMKHDCSVSDC
ncbi:MAG TPA: U32 family peptidase [Candidatus Omnitrophota bacterium]|nr:U32 family peptidase [Candidatus Omnitrophota bacterium]